MDSSCERVRELSKDDSLRTEEQTTIMYGGCRKMVRMDGRGEASTSVIVERRARNVMLRRHDAASSKDDVERSVSGAWRPGSSQGGR